MKKCFFIFIGIVLFIMFNFYPSSIINEAGFYVYKFGHIIPFLSIRTNVFIMDNLFIFNIIKNCENYFINIIAMVVGFALIELYLYIICSLYKNFIIKPKRSAW